MPPRMGNRLSGIVRAAAVEMAVAHPEPPPPAPPTPAPPPAPVPIAVKPQENVAAKQAARDAQALRELLTALTRQVEELRQRRMQSIADLSGLSIELAFALAERLLQTEIAADRQRLDRIVQGALERLPAARAVTVRGHGDDIALLEKQMADSKSDALTFRTDATLTRGRLILEADDFFVEWDTSKCLAELRGALDEANAMDG